MTGTVEGCTQHLVYRLPPDREGLTHRFEIHGVEGSLKGYLTVNTYEGKVVELFIRMDKTGSTLRGFIDAWAIQASKRLRAGVDLADVIRDVKGTRFEPSGRTSTPGIRTCSSPLDYIGRYLERRFIHRLPLDDQGGDAPRSQDA